MPRVRAVVIAALLLGPAVARTADAEEDDWNKLRTVDIDVFDLTVETTHAYFAGGVLAHNY